MAKVSQAEFLARFQQGISGGGQRFEKGVDNSEPWAENYASPDSQARMQQGLAAAIAAGKPAEGARALGTSGWRSKTKAKSGNYTASAQTAATNIGPYVGQILASGDAMKAAAAAVTGPKNTATAIAKVSASIRAAKSAWGKE